MSSAVVVGLVMIGLLTEIVLVAGLIIALVEHLDRRRIHG
jgi:hypothetical protein